MVSSMVGVILGRAASYGRSAPLKSLMEMYKYGMLEFRTQFTLDIFIIHFDHGRFFLGETPIMTAVTVGVCRFVLGKQFFFNMAVTENYFSWFPFSLFVISLFKLL